MRSTRAAGSALILVLFLLALLVIMVLSLFDSSRIDRSQSSQHLERTRAMLMAQEGIERTVAILQRETVNPPRHEAKDDAGNKHYAARQRNWISQPGLLIVPEEPNADPTDISINQKELHRRVELSSGLPTPNLAYDDPVLEPAELNIQLLTEQSATRHLITNLPDGAGGGPSSMKLRWVYVRDDIANGTVIYDTSEGSDLKLDDRDKPIVGRFAWWVDDESTKINYNLAWKRTPEGSASTHLNLNPPSHPSTINLMALKSLAGGSYLTEAMADALHHWTATAPKRYFNSFADARQVTSPPGDAGEIGDYLRDNQFELTHYNHDPDVTFFGEERILLTTNRDLVPKNPDGTYARRFIDILIDGEMKNLDPGKRDHIAGGQSHFEGTTSGGAVANKYDAAVRMIMDYLSRADWPVAPGLNFKDKYYSRETSDERDSRLAQIAVNIIDYVRSRESRLPVVAPLRVGLRKDSTQRLAYTLNLQASWDYNALQGVTRAPLITEMGAYVEKEPDPVVVTAESKALYPIYFKIEVHLPKNYNIPDGIDLVPDPNPKPNIQAQKNWFVGFSLDDKSGYHWLSPDGVLFEDFFEKKPSTATRIFAHEISGGKGDRGTKLMPGEYVVITKKFYTEKPYKDRSSLRSGGGMLIQNATHDYEYALRTPDVWSRVCLFPQWNKLIFKMSDPETTTMDNMDSAQTDDPRCGVHIKDWTMNIPNTFGKQNSTYRVGQDPNVAAGEPQQDTDANGKISDHSLYMPPARVDKNPPRDNGRVVSVGELGYIHTGVNSSWDYSDGSVSWRTIRLQPNRYASETDMLPDWLLMDLFSAPPAANVDDDHLHIPHGTAVGGRININALVEPFTDMQRNRGLVALMLGANRVANPSEAEQIANNIFLRTLAPGKHGNFGKAYGYPWGEALPNVYDTPGEICEIAGIADDGEQGEDRVRSIASNITVKGGVFSVYTVGQALKQTPSGKLIVTGEERLQAIIERYRNTFDTEDPEDDRVQFRTIYLRQLNN